VGGSDCSASVRSGASGAGSGTLDGMGGGEVAADLKGQQEELLKSLDMMK
jgi:hypothetical protein